MMKHSTPPKIFLKDYTPCDYLIRKVELSFELAFNSTKVRSRLHVHKNHSGPHRPLQLDGEQLELQNVWLDEKLLSSGDFVLSERGLTLFPQGDHFFVEIENTISPEKNFALEGLYKAGEVLLTQCEPHGLRRITYFVDRPDNMAVFSARLEGDKTQFPYLLCNGNFIARGDLPNNRHFVQWEDPFPKPSYLFALVAGEFHQACDTFQTRCGRRVELELYVDKGEEEKCRHAIESLKRAMQWDEQTYGLEYDLDLYMIVATNHFNMGAMENKGLNIFNSVYVLAHPQTATDKDYEAIESVIGHEYFHNWSGNRVTCRDWFQLTLKEGLTVYRDQEFSCDLHDRSVKRIQDVQRLRETQFLEDAGPNRHPIRPDHYIEINNFYTSTVYEKGAEVIRMLEVILGKENFKKGLRLYFERHDGEAATCEDFLTAMSDASSRDLSVFKNWYQRAGTPEVQVVGQSLPGFFEWDFRPLKSESEGRGGAHLGLHIPIKVAWFNQQGSFLGENLIELIGEGNQSLRIPWNEENTPVLSVNRSFSAPIKIQYVQNAIHKKVLAIHEIDGFARYEAIFELMVEELNQRIAGQATGRSFSILVEIFSTLLKEQTTSASVLATMCGIPTCSFLMQSQSILRPEQTLRARHSLAQDLGQALTADWEKCYRQLHQQEKGDLGPQARSSRAWKNRILKYLVSTGDQRFQALSYTQLMQAQTMTDAEAALRILCQTTGSWREKALSWWEQKWESNPLVMYKWLMAQSTSEASDTLERVRLLCQSRFYDRKIPNSVYALMRGLVMNPGVFHDPSGVGYEIIAEEMITLDQFNPQVAARLSTGLNSYRHLPTQQKHKAKQALERVLARENISPNLFEKISNILCHG